MDMHFERLYEDNVPGKNDDARFVKISKPFEVPDHRKSPERDILLKMRKGVALSYAAEQIPKDARGRFVTGDGTVFQSYLLDEGQL